MRLKGAPSERVVDYFTSHLFENYQNRRHVRRVASWVAFIVLGIERLAGAKWKVPRERQLRFEYKGRSFKARFNHRIGRSTGIKRGGIEIVEILPGRGSPQGRSVLSIISLNDAERFYRQPTIP